MGNVIQNPNKTQSAIILPQNTHLKLMIPICPKCPLTPIISIVPSSQGNVLCEYRCPFFHMGITKFENLFLKDDKYHGKICRKCKIKIQENKNLHSLFCGTCQKFFCSNCAIDHRHNKGNNPFVNISEVDNICLEHKTNFSCYCFSCLKSICKKCLYHENHCVKKFNEFEPKEDFLEKLNFYYNDIDKYFKYIKNYPKINLIDYNQFERKNVILLNFVKSLHQNYINKKNSGTLRGEIIINLLNVVKFNFNTLNLNTELDRDNGRYYLTHHLIIKNNPISYTCSFSKSKANYLIENLKIYHYKDLNYIDGNDITFNKMDYDFIAYNIGNILYFMKDKEAINFCIKLEENIISYSQLKQHLIAICTKHKIYIYKLLNIEPYFIECTIKIPDVSKIKQIYGNLFENIFILTKKEIIKLNNNNKLKGAADFNLMVINRKNYFVDPYNNTHNNVINDNVDDIRSNSNSDSDSINNKRKNENENLVKKFNYCIKGIVKNYLVIYENGCLIIRNDNNLEIMEIDDIHFRISDKFI